MRPSDRSGYERSNSWGNPIGRPDQRSRPHSSPATRHFDDKTPFLTHTARIGRNFDEDERKPLDGVSAPRRTISDESIRVPPTHVELKAEYGPIGTLAGQQVLAPSEAVNSYAGKVSEVTYSGLNMQNLGGHSGQGVGGGHPNAWAVRKEATEVNDPVQQPAWSGPSAVSKLAHASALEKVSSGRWQPKHSFHYQPDVEVIMSSESESGFQSKSYGNISYNRVDVAGAGENYDVALVRQAERGMNNEDSNRVGKEFSDYERAGSPMYSELKDRNSAIHTDRTPVARNDVKPGPSELHPPVPSEPIERPKLKLLPRTRPLGSSVEQPVIDQAQVSARLPSDYLLNYK